MYNTFLRRDPFPSRVDVLMPSVATVSAGTGGSIRNQAKKDKASAGHAHPNGSAPLRMDKEIVKAVLASPLVVPW